MRLYDTNKIDMGVDSKRSDYWPCVALASIHFKADHGLFQYRQLNGNKDASKSLKQSKLAMWHAGSSVRLCR